VTTRWGWRGTPSPGSTKTVEFCCSDPLRVWGITATVGSMGAFEEEAQRQADFEAAERNRAAAHRARELDRAQTEASELALGQSHMGEFLERMQAQGNPGVQERPLIETYWQKKPGSGLYRWFHGYGPAAKSVRKRRDLGTVQGWEIGDQRFVATSGEIYLVAEHDRSALEGKAPSAPADQLLPQLVAVLRRTGASER
jgi:hypothetical protein